MNSFTTLSYIVSHIFLILYIYLLDRKSVV